MKKVLIASMIGMVTSGAYSMQTLTDGEMSLVEGQALLNFSKDNYAYTTSKQERVNFYKLGLDVEMELNTNIKSLQLGCGGINNSSRSEERRVGKGSRRERGTYTEKQDKETAAAA